MDHGPCLGNLRRQLSRPVVVGGSGADPAELRRALAAGARGIKLRPHAERFTFAHPRIGGILAAADEAGVPVLVHAGYDVLTPAGGIAMALLATPESRLVR